MKSSDIHKGEEMKRTLFIILSVVVVFLIIGVVFTGLLGPRSANTFSSVSYGSPFGMGGGGAPEMESPAMPAPAYDSYAAEESARSSVSNDAGYVQQTQERLVIENADLAIVVEDPKARMDAISDLARELGGFVVSSNMYQSYSPLGEEVPEATVVIRVPSEKLDEALVRIKKDVIEVDYENRSGQDVTNQYVDLQARLKAKQAAEEKLLEIMDQATRAEDVLAVYLQVQAVQTEIEQLKGQIKYLEESAALSSISVRIIAQAATQSIKIGPWTPSGAVKEAIQDLILFFQNFVEFLIRFVLYILPALILIAIPFYLLFLGGRAAYRRFIKPQVAVEEKHEEIKG
jgi:hypothetical protein